MDKIISSKVKKQYFYFVAIAFLLTQISCVPFLRLKENTKFISANQTNKKVFAEEFDLNSESDLVKKDIYKLLLAKDFVSIEKIANSAREKKERLSGGYWKLDSIYEALINIYAEYQGQEVTDELWKNRIELLKQWKESSPNSITANIAFAESYVGYGFFARGTGYINTVSEENYNLFHKRIDIAEKEMIKVKELNLKCPRLYRDFLHIKMLKGAEKEDFESFFEESIKFEPNYLQFYLVKSEYLTPKWHGQPGEWQIFIDSLPSKLDTLKSAESNLIYSVVVLNKLKDSSLNLNWAMVSKERMKNGFMDMETKYGVDKHRLNQFALFSCITQDFAYAKPLFDKIGNDWSKEIWGQQSFFNSMKQVANQSENIARK